MKPVTRRFAIAGAVVTAVTFPYAAARLLWAKPEDIVLAVLHRRLGYLNVHPRAFEQFASEYVQDKAEHRAQLQRLGLLSYPYRFVTAYGLAPVGHPLRRMEDNIVSMFLMSTDFFEHGADERRPIRYVAFYDPARTPCRNFLAQRIMG